MDIFKENKYISLKDQQEIKKELFFIISKYKKIKYFLKRKKLTKKYKKLDKIIIKHNEELIKKEIEKTKHILDNINGYPLDMEQRKAVITDEDSYLICAGAGSGKTLTMIGKIRYLIEHKKVNPKDILCISFTNFTTSSLKKAIQKQTTYNIDVYTFHKLGLEIIKKKGLKINITSEKTLENIIKKYFNEEILVNRDTLYDFVTNCLLLEPIKFKESIVNNDEEIIIENYLYFYNIDYEYKLIGIYKQKSIYAFYLSKYNIYIKYYKTSEESDNLNISNYLNEVEIVRKYFKGKVLELYPYQFKDGTIYDVINDFFKKNNIKGRKNKINEIYNTFLCQNYFNKIIITFINMFKSKAYSYQKFEEIDQKINKIKNKIERNKLTILLKIIKQIYNNYQLYLIQNNELDFNDMILKATNLIEIGDVNINYKYIIIDEYQDTSYCRYKLIKAIKEINDSKLVAVGDDFQSIYKFTGCDLNMFLNFQNYFPNSKILYLTNTYRNSSELIKVAGDFIMKNKYQIKKQLYSEKKIYKPIKLYFYKRKNEIHNLLKNINEKDIFVLGRNNNDINFLKDFDIIDNKIKYLDKNITFMSIHKSKGLESEAVIIVNLEDKPLGFPSKIEENILIHYLNNIKEYYPFDEERRLFYVALTRTKKNVYLFVPFKNKSPFISEIIKDNKKLIEFIN